MSGQQPSDGGTGRDAWLARGDEQDGVRVVAKEPPQVRAGERTRRLRVGAALALSILSGVAFVVVYVAWPNEYRAPTDPDDWVYLLYTPLLGITFGCLLLSLGLGTISYVRSFYPDETAVQERSDGPSSEEQRGTATARFAEAGEDTGFGRRSLLRRLGLGGIGVAGLVSGVVAVGGFVKDPWRGGDDAPLWTTAWRPVGGETVYLRVATGDPSEIVRIRPDDMAPGSLVSVVPFRESERDDPKSLEEAEHRADSPAMLIRLPAGTPVVQAPGQEDFHAGEFYAYSKLCTHLGCPAALYDAVRSLIECPCHQSVFRLTEYARPVFGPATRPLPQLPIAVDAQGYFVARGDFSDPVGPGFWEVRAGMH